MCGIIGLVYTAEKNCTQALVDGLTVLQHRGQDAAGIVTIRDNRLNLRKDLGTVAEVFNQDNVMNLEGNVGIGHVRYPTAGWYHAICLYPVWRTSKIGYCMFWRHYNLIPGGSGCSAEAQPLYTNAPFGIALAHNGNLTNTNDLAISMRHERRHINTNSDSGTVNFKSNWNIWTKSSSKCSLCTHNNLLSNIEFLFTSCLFHL